MARKIALLAAGTLLLAACSSGKPAGGPVDPAANVTITWWTGQAADPEKVLEDLAAEFHKAHPNVTINVSSGASTTDALLQKITAGFAGDQYPDISYAYGSWASELASSGRTLDITDKVNDPAVRWSEFPEAARQTATPGGQVIGFPSLVDNLSLLYNKTVFDNAHVPYPTNDWTWDDFRKAAKQLTNAATNTYGFGFTVEGSEDTTWQLWPLLWQLGGDVLSPDGKKSAFASPAGVKALDFLRSMAVDDKSVYLDQTTEKYGPLFYSNQIGMIISGPYMLHDLTTHNTQYGVTYLPAFEGKHTSISGPDLWVLLDHKDPNRAYWSYELTKWLTEPEQDARWNLAMGNLPLRASETATPAFEDLRKQAPGIDVMAANAVNVTKPRPTVQGYVGLSQAVGEAVSKTLQGAATSKEALDAAAAKADQALAGN
ncbi:ABC transporter substrate-binding protein [Actinocrispum wychmicini]|uniref:Multiple sugar transport system substrate-binding protein n=1 Tax=Actinocrispum wychmicini TaxID=1213861 RepID=A0A4V2S662_9PSEU|nr:ABC transporter substrate-binding protein [Actinocrispum wychmicini]TCO54830.1 multiple sugar transport system substrate-binding protein [Actinocrispum wychmicini]